MSIMDRLNQSAPKSTKDTLLDTVIGKLLDNLPPETLSQISYIAQWVKNVDARLSGIETSLAEISRRADNNPGHIASVDSGISTDNIARKRSET